ncbi:MAG: tRNA guanosine(34) transglycosylase Tgt [Polyangiaceae bacterium]|nr:tRNA guanosine(34) transglycosylase Tgt [Polyangiaceae bacterium]
MTETTTNPVSSGTDGRTPGYAFRVTGSCGKARTGVLTTPHGEVPTPTFMPVGTQGSVKTLTPAEVAATGARIVLGNTYHLWLRPGPDLVAKLGGLHGFTKWPHAMLTDSGGFQAFSLSEMRTVSEDGFVFRSHLDGAKCALSPEVAMQVQGALGADIAMQLDICPPGGAPRADVEAACARTTRWAKRCLAAKSPTQAVFGIVQGGSFADLRRAHADELAAMPFDGLALGGFSVGEPIEEMHRVLNEVASHLDAERPRYLMGVGTPADLVRAIGAGVDMFDCVLPTRNARNGQALLRGGRIVIKQARYKDDPLPLDPTCPCPACAGGFSRAYLRHLFLAGEILVLRLLSVHNLTLYGTLVREAREAIQLGRYDAFARSWLENASTSEPRDA